MEKQVADTHDISDSIPDCGNTFGDALRAMLLHGNLYRGDCFCIGSCHGCSFFDLQG